jgi:peptidoglycan hydrolase-like protein with peptidoglycan-binding domain
VPAVRLLQSRLGIASDGRFGKDTDAAVRRFQGQRGLLVDGKVGHNTWTALLAVTV